MQTSDSEYEYSVGRHGVHSLAPVMLEYVFVGHGIQEVALLVGL